MGIAGWKLLVGRSNKLERRGKSRHSSEKLSHRGNCLCTHKQTPLAKVQLQQWCLYSLWRELSEHFCGLAVFLVGPTELALPHLKHFFVLHLFHNKLNQPMDGLVGIVGIEGIRNRCPNQFSLCI